MALPPQLMLDVVDGVSGWLSELSLFDRSERASSHPRYSEKQNSQARLRIPLGW
jgi:hypothetical protein